MVSKGIEGVRLATVATVGSLIGSSCVVVTGVVIRSVSSIASAASAVGAARINTTPITHKPIAAAAGSAAGSTKRAPNANPNAAPPKSETHNTIDFHML